MGVGAIAVNCRRKVKSAVPREGGGGRGGGCGYVVFVIGLLSKVSLRYVVFSVIQLLVESKSPWVSKSVPELSPRSPLRFADCVAELSFR